MSNRAYITPNVLKWARESARITVETAATKVAVSSAVLTEWENGVKQPTIRQAQTLAKLYKRPFALLFLPDVPRDFQPLQDFRRSGSKALSTSSVFIIREIQQKQAWISEVNSENQASKLAFVGRFSINDSPQVVASDILKTLELNPAFYKTENQIREWIEAAERKGIFVSRTSFIHSRLKLDSEELKGFAIADVYAPFVFVNSDDWNAAQLFTLVHELAHIWIAQSGISTDVDADKGHERDIHPIELFCNEVAACALMPTELILQMKSSSFANAKEIFKKSRNFGVSSLSFLIRAYKLNVITLDTFEKLKLEVRADYIAFLKKEEDKKARQKETAGGPNYFLLQVNRNSRLFTQTVLDAFRSGVIEPTAASNLLNMQTSKFSKLESQLFS